MSSCAKHEKTHPLFPQFGESSKPFSAGGKSAWWLAGRYPDVPTVRPIPARACHMSLSRPKIFPNTRKNSGRDVRMPMNCRRRVPTLVGIEDFGRWGTWDVEAIGIDSYWFMFQTTKWPTMGWWNIFLNIFFTWDFWNSKWDNFTWLLHNYPWPAFGVLCFPTLLPAVPL